MSKIAQKGSDIIPIGKTSPDTQHEPEEEEVDHLHVLGGLGSNAFLNVVFTKHTCSRARLFPGIILILLIHQLKNTERYHYVRFEVFL